ncbi:MAG: cytochrome c [Acidimicrobiia bacterium]|nr:cytochrome c [Acidimicrobiia bacterium]
MGIGAIVLGLAVISVLGWLTFLTQRSRVRRRREADPLNQSYFMDDDTMETKRLNSILLSALVATVVLAIVMPVYYLSEAGRQEASIEQFDEIAVERGHEWFLEFQCGDCHGPSGGGGGADYVEDRSGITTSWAAPAINDVLYRYTPDEARYWLVFGRAGSPMPAWGTEGGGPLNTQQIDELLAYLEHITIPQTELAGQADSKVDLALARLDGADAAVATLIERQTAEIAALAEAPSQLAAIGDAPTRLKALLTESGTCTAESAAFFASPCDDPGADGDGDGLTDAAEVGMSGIIAEVIDIAPAGDPVLVLDPLAFDPGNAYTTETGGTPIPDLEEVRVAITEIDNIARNLNLAVTNAELLTASAEAGMAFLQEAAAARRWEFDFTALTAAFDGDAEAAQQAAGLFNAYCARCHTAGYSAGVAFTKEAGSGGFGPSLRGGRSIIQFPDFEDQLDFVVKGSENGKQYGVNGVGRGWMPGFGTSLPESDLRLIITLVRALP